MPSRLHHRYGHASHGGAPSLLIFVGSIVLVYAAMALLSLTIPWI